MHIHNLDYHPIRFGYQLEGFFKSFIAQWEDARQDLPDNAGGLLAGTMLEHMFTEMIQQHAESLPRHIVEHADWWGTHIERLITAYKDYRQGDEDIHHFTPDLIRKLSGIAQPDLKYSDLDLPGSAFYIRFDYPVPSAPMKLVDGVYITDYYDPHSGLDPAIEFTFTAVNPTTNYLARLPPIKYLTADRFYSFLLTQDDNITFSQAIAECLREDSQEDGWDSDVGLDWFPFVPNLIGLALNCLVHISNIDTESEYAYPCYTPEHLLDAARNAPDDKQFDKAIDDLHHLGYQKISYYQ